MLKAVWTKYRLHFRFLARTSRSAMRCKDTYFVKVFDTDRPEVFGVGECNLFKGLSADDVPEYEQVLDSVCSNPTAPLPAYSSIIFGLETALADLAAGGHRIVFDCPWIATPSRPITINGLVWMGGKRTMIDRVKDKLQAGFTCLKLKIGGIDFDDEVDILRSIRRQFPEDVLTIRLDANGAFSPDSAMSRLERLSQYGIHSIEQPIRAGNVVEMARLCASSPIPIALDEELIGCRTHDEKEALLDEIRPRYIILKPALCGGFSAADDYLSIARSRGIGLWATSALESNIGLNAIAQWASSRLVHSAEGNPSFPQGLGTGELFTDNIPSSIILDGDRLRYDNTLNWQLPDFFYENC